MQNMLTAGCRQQSDTGTAIKVEFNTTKCGSMSTAVNYEAIGADMAYECLDNILNSPDQAASCRYLLGLLNSISGCGELENGARRGATIALVNVLKRDLDAIRADATVQKTNESAGHSAFYRIDNPRELRLLAELLKRSEVSRHELDGLIGAENSPDVVFRLRQRDFGIPCERRQFIDRDGQKVRAGFYSLTPTDRQRAISALRPGGA